MHKPYTKKLLFALSIFVALAAIIYTGLYIYASNNKSYVMDGPSMEPTISNGEQVKAKVTPANNVQRGDVIVFKNPSVENGRLIKRVVGLPGDTIIIADGQLTVTKPDKTTYKPYDSTVGGNLTATVKANSFYVLGDNAQNSLDSRVFGDVPFNDLLSVVEKR
jgi:signal peptidase I